MKRDFRHILHLASVIGLLSGIQSARAVNIQDDLTQATTTLSWTSINGACLTAGNNAAGSVPACVGLPYYSGDTNAKSGGATGTLPDTPGFGALRFTDWFSQNGAVVSNFTFPANQGVSATFTTVTYQGDKGGLGGDGADGISFFLMDGSLAAPSSIGSWGGSLGYSCSNANTPYQGLIGAYVGLGIDEYGNFLNAGDNTATSGSTVNGNTQVPNRIGLRGAGNIAWPWLNKNYSNYYPSTLTSASDQAAAVQNTCKSGYLWDYSSYAKGVGQPSQTSTTVLDYPAIPGANTVLASGFKIANETAVKRGDGTPITYNLQITQDGLLSLSYKLNGGNYQPVLTKQSISASNGALPATLRFGFAGSTGGSRNIHEITCFQATPADQSDSAAGVNTQQAAQLRTGTQVYLSYFHPANWWGQLTSQNLVYDPVTSAVSISNTVNWDGSCVLTGGACATTGATSGTAEAPTARTILTWSGTAGIPFEWASLSTAQQTALDAGDATQTANRLNFLRGDRSNELTTTGTGLYRTRTSVLGDIEHSNPTWVGPPSAPYVATWADALNPSTTQPENGTGAQSYPSFATSMVTRTNIVYSGANDGMLHGFRSGAYDGQISSGNPYGNYVSGTTSPNDGLEALAYMPGQVLQTIHSTTNTADFSSSSYAHAFSVDATPVSGEVFYGKAWHSLLVGGLGAGGAAIYALDVTDPSKFSESNAASLVFGEWNASNMPCVVTGCGNNLGNTYGTPAIRRFHNGMWGIVFGNGFASSTGHAGVYIITIDPSTAATKAYYLDAGADPTGAARPDGIAYTTPVDLDGDHIVDYIYAGDLLGNVWRFDVTSTSPANWVVSKFGGASAQPLFTTPQITSGTTTTTQPITTKLLVLSTPATTGAYRVMVEFGTGQEFPATTLAATSYAAGQQAVYGIWDWNMAAWNALNPSASYASLSGTGAPTTTLAYVSTSAAPILATQTITQISATSGSTPGTRTITGNAVCWSGSSSCPSNNNQFGFVANLPTSGEQVIYSPVVYQGAMIINSTIPPNSSVFACSSTLPSGWTLAFAPTNGGTFSNSFFPNVNNAFVQVPSPGNPTQLVSVTGIALNATGTPAVVSALNNPYLINQTTSGLGNATRINPPKNVTPKRINWTQLR